jgi:hypothetical protein
MGEMGNAYNILVGKRERKRPDRKIILEWILGKQDERVWGWIHHLTQDRNSGGPCEHGNEPPGYKRAGGSFSTS